VYSNTCKTRLDWTSLQLQTNTEVAACSVWSIQSSFVGSTQQNYNTVYSYWDIYTFRG